MGRRFTALTWVIEDEWPLRWLTLAVGRAPPADPWFANKCRTRHPRQSQPQHPHQQLLHQLGAPTGIRGENLGLQLCIWTSDLRNNH